MREREARAHGRSGGGGGGGARARAAGARTWIASEKSFSSDIVVLSYTGPSNLMISSPAGMGCVGKTPRPLMGTGRSSRCHLAHSSALLRSLRMRKKRGSGCRRCERAGGWRGARTGRATHVTLSLIWLGTS